MNTNGNIINKILKKIYLINRIDFVVEYSKIKKQNSIISSKEKEKPSIIIAPFTFDNSHAFEAIYARKAIQEGKRVYNFLCGHGVDYCEKKGSGSKLNTIRCRICHQTQIDYIKEFEADGYFIGEGIKNIHNARMNEYILKNKNRKKQFDSFMGIDVNKILFSALQRFYFEAEPSTAFNNVTIGFLTTILKTIIEFDNLCKNINPEYVIVSHGTYSSWGSIVEYCKVNKIRVIVWGRTYNKYGIYFSEGESYLTEMVNGSTERWRNDKLSFENKNIIEDFFDMRTGQKTRDFLYDYNKKQKEHLSTKEVREMYNIPNNSKIVGMFPNIPWDGSVSGVSEAFSSYREWLYRTIDFFGQRRDAYLLIRTHPAEVASDAEIGRETLQTLIDELGYNLPSNIIVIPSDSKVNSFSVGKASAYGIFYCSTVGMELTYLGVPLVCAGPSPLRNKNIVYDAENKQHYIELLEKGMQDKLFVTESMKENLLKFSYYNMFTRVMPETIIKFEGTIFTKILASDEAEVLNNRILDHLYKTIENKEDYNFDRMHEMIL